MAKVIEMPNYAFRVTAKNRAVDIWTLGTMTIINNRVLTHGNIAQLQSGNVILMLL